LKITQRYELGPIAVVALSLLQAGLRIVLGLMMTGALGEGAQSTLNGAIEGQVDDWVLSFNTVMFLTLGVLGAIFAVGLPGHASWAWYGTITVCAVTIIYDAWAMITIQPTAVLGIMLPTVLIAYLLWKRTDFGIVGVSSYAGIGSVRN
jgi:uncharacterized membrane protein (DUF2068 family)